MKITGKLIKNQYYAQIAAILAFNLPNPYLPKCNQKQRHNKPTNQSFNHCCITILTHRMPVTIANCCKCAYTEV